MKKFLNRIQVGMFVFMVTAATAFAQSPSAPGLIPTILPSQDTAIGGAGPTSCVGLATMIRNGDISLASLPCFLKYFSKTLITLAGSLCLIFIMIGGYQYVMGGSESEAEAKKTVTHALIGLAVTLLAWILVGIALQAATE